MPGSGLRFGEVSDRGRDAVATRAALTYFRIYGLTLPETDWMAINLGAGLVQSGEVVADYQTGNWHMVRVADVPAATVGGTASATSGLVFPDAVHTGEDVYLAEDDGNLLIASSSDTITVDAGRIVPVETEFSATTQFAMVADQDAAEAKPDDDGVWHFWPEADMG